NGRSTVVSNSGGRVILRNGTLQYEQTAPNTWQIGNPSAYVDNTFNIDFDGAWRWDIWARAASDHMTWVHVFHPDWVEYPLFPHSTGHPSQNLLQEILYTDRWYSHLEFKGWLIDGPYICGSNYGFIRTPKIDAQ